MYQKAIGRMLNKRAYSPASNAPVFLLEPFESRRLLSATFTTLVNANGGDLFYPGTGVISDAAGNLFGTTYKGGTLGDGTVYEVAAVTHSFTTLASLTVPNDEIVSGVIEDSAGNLYGETYGSTDGGTPGTGGYGTLFEVAAGSHALSTLASFDGTDGANPQGGLLLDSAGNLYGSATFGGSTNSGTIFKVANGSGTVTVLHDFDLNTSTVGIHPNSNLVADGSGNLYGVSTAGIFKIAAGSGAISIYSDTSSNALIIDSNGNLFGTSGNKVLEIPAGGGASVTLATTNGTTSVGTALLENAAGDLFGETDTDGSSSGGSIFEVVIGSGIATTIYTINPNPLSIPLLDPAGGLAEDALGNLYGVTASSGDGDGESLDTGTLFEISSLGGGSSGATAAKLAFSQQPSDVVAGSSIAPSITVDVEDSGGTIITSDNSSVTLAIGTDTGGGALSGTLTEQAVNGVATFSDVSISTSGNYTLTATDGSLSTATSNAFNVNGGGTISTTTGLIPTTTADTVPSAVVAGQPLHSTVKLKLTNSTATIEKGSTVKVFASTTPILDTSTAALIATLTKTPAVKPGKFAAVSVPIKTFPATLPSGAYYIIEETSDSAGNNPYTASSSTVSVTAPYVALSATVAAVKPAVVTSKKPGSVLITLTNSGNVTAVGSLIITLSPSADGLSAIPGVTLATFTVHHVNLKPGKPGKYSLHFKLPAGLTAGSYFPYATISLASAQTTSVGVTLFTTG